MNGLTVKQYTAPSAWAPYLINGDDSGMEDTDITAADQWIDQLGYGSPVSCEDAGFIHWHDAREVCPFAADCQTYVFLHRA